jgi:pimeloyl-ACP methyl ester carboxylesterase
VHFTDWKGCRGVVRFPQQLVTLGRSLSPPVPSDPAVVAAVRARPALLVQGMRDTALLPRYTVSAFQLDYPDAPVVRLSDVGHFTPEDAPETVLALLDLFLQST